MAACSTVAIDVYSHSFHIKAIDTAACRHYGAAAVRRPSNRDVCNTFPPVQTKQEMTAALQKFTFRTNIWYEEGLNLSLTVFSVIFSLFLS